MKIELLLVAFCLMAQSGLRPVPAAAAKHIQAMANNLTDTVPLSAQKHLAQIASLLPEGSTMRRQLETGAHGDGVHYAWMDQMRQLGVKRATVILRFDWRRHPVNIAPVRILYFDKYDSDCAQISAPERLHAIEASGLTDQLRRFAIGKTKKSNWWYREHRPHASKGTGWVEVVDDEWMPHAPPILNPVSRSLPPLFESIMHMDELSVREIVGSGLSKLDMNAGLISAAGRDDTCIVRDLLRAGADPNAKTVDQVTALMNAAYAGLTRNVQVLLSAGADPARRDSMGRTALDYARQNQRLEVAHLLENSAR